MDDVGVARLIRALRIRRGWRQLDLAVAAGICRQQVSRAELAQFDRLPLGALRTIARALDIRLPFDPSWRGGDPDRIVNERHTLLQQRVCELLGASGWTCAPEVTFSIFGERGSIDVLGWHAASRSLLVVEIKPDLGDPGSLISQVHRYQRLAPQIARERGWLPASVSTWVVVAESTMNRGRIAKVETLLHTAFPVGAREIRAWRQRPLGHVAALSLLGIAHLGGRNHHIAQTVRVRRPRNR